MTETLKFCCWRCNPRYICMGLCRVCGNKRCPKASDCRLYCTNSNEVGQYGSVYANADKPHEVVTGNYGTAYCKNCRCVINEHTLINEACSNAGGQSEGRRVCDSKS